MTEDIQPNNRKSLKEVLPKDKFRQSVNRFPREKNGDDSGEGEIPKSNHFNLSAKRSFMPKTLLWSVIGLFIVFVLIGISTTLVKVNVDIVPTQAMVDLPEGEQAIYQAQNAPSSQNLEFGVIMSELKESKTVLASGTENVSRYAKGEVTIYNAYSDEDQTLINQTRFADSTGRIYRIQEAISVPGYTTEGGEKVPGELTVSVRADQAGDEYNIGLSKFTVPGLEGTPQFDQIYAESVTPMTGGFVGEISQVAEAEKEAAASELEESLKAKLSESTNLEIPPGHFLFPDTQLTYFTTEVLPAEGNQAIIEGKMISAAIVFNREILAEFLARELINDYEGGRITIRNPEELEFNLLDHTPDDLRQLQNIEFSLTGQAHLIWQVDEEAVKTALAGQPKDSYQIVLEDISAIARMRPKIFPPWIRTIPDNSEKIKINLIID